MSSMTPEPEPLPSLPSTPIQGHATGSESPNGTQLDTPPTPPEKESLDTGKGKARITDSPTPYDEVAAPAEINSSSEEDVKLDEAEARKVEENLRRWELAEREKRKAAREVISSSSSGSIVGDVTRRASLLWSGKTGQRPSSGLGSHRAVRTHESEEGVPMEDLDPSPPVSAANSPEPSFSRAAYETENPFENPAHIRSDSTTSVNTPGRSAVMSESSESTLVPSTSMLNPKGRRQSRHHPPPEPLDIPRPRTPPPRSETPHANKPPEPIPPPRATPIEDDGHLTEVPETRWWTDWLCGCNEGPNRGGDNQAGRTNPFA